MTVDKLKTVRKVIQLKGLIKRPKERGISLIDCNHYVCRFDDGVCLFPFGKFQILC
jgi:Zn-finger protein